MAPERSWAETVRFVHARANAECEYCRTGQRVMGQAMHVEHIDPDGGDHADNLCLACPTCNLSKARATTAPDPQSGAVVRLFNPRIDRWDAHFRWVQTATVVQGITPIGRATVERLRMNAPRVVVARRIWVRAGAHPPA
jgi:ketopantoate reductase